MTVTASVIIPAYNEADTLPGTLDSLAEQDCEVVIVAAGDDGTLEISEEHPATDIVLPDERKAGPAAACNDAAEHASGDIYLFTDADTTVPDDWVEQHVQHFRDGPADLVGVGGSVRPLRDSFKHEMMQKLLFHYGYGLSALIGIPQLIGSNCSYRASAFHEAGGFDEEISFMDDLELSLRMRHYGETRFDPDIIVETSMRRWDEEGYLSLSLLFVHGYVDEFLLGKHLDTDYFKEFETSS